MTVIDMTETNQTVASNAVHRSHATTEMHSTYMGQPVVKSTSWITTTTTWFSGALQADTLKALRAKIKSQQATA